MGVEDFGGAVPEGGILATGVDVVAKEQYLEKINYFVYFSSII